MLLLLWLCILSHHVWSGLVFQVMGFSKFLFTKFRFAFFSLLVTAKALFDPVNSVMGGIIGRLCTNYGLVGAIQSCLTLGFCLGHCIVSLLEILLFMTVGQ